TCMYYTGLNYETGKPIEVPKGRELRLRKALIQWYKEENKILIKEFLTKHKRNDLIPFFLSSKKKERRNAR
ncbi:MAG: YgiQ family radical SAM protein, partial [Candidatus Cloacimonetes bacterium]|nr:YgiQ family radical SAM protein [Candidatus Cloacimonadota bacterium]